MDKPSPLRFPELPIVIDKIQNWPRADLDVFFNAIGLFASFLGRPEVFANHLGELIVEKTDTGRSLGLAQRGRIRFSTRSSLTTWTVLHELAHTWDAKNDWKLSVAMEKFTGGFTNKKLSALKRWNPLSWDAGKLGSHNKAGFYGRKPGCNAAGYFYGDKPSGSNWNFNKKEDFAESLVMYCGWERNNELSRTAHGRIERYLLPNGTKDPLYGITDNWSDYAAFFYPPNGNYSKTKRWKFIDELINPK